MHSLLIYESNVLTTWPRGRQSSGPSHNDPLGIPTNNPLAIPNEPLGIPSHPLGIPSDLLAEDRWEWPELLLEMSRVTTRNADSHYKEYRELLQGMLKITTRNAESYYN